VGEVIAGALAELAAERPEELVARRYRRFRRLGVYEED
jgi:acetyl-CoA carboxylase alpha subunit